MKTVFWLWGEKFPLETLRSRGAGGHQGAAEARTGAAALSPADCTRAAVLSQHLNRPPTAKNSKGTSRGYSRVSKAPHVTPIISQSCAQSTVSIFLRQVLLGTRSRRRHPGLGAGLKTKQKQVLPEKEPVR